MMKTTRDSNLELLRIVAMWMIVFYHLHIYVLQPTSGLFLAIQLPLHTAVLLFILISGYFGIKTKIKSLCKLVSQVFCYSIFSLEVTFVYINYIHPNESISLSITDIIDSILCFSSGNLWFIRTYLYLFLTAPFINKILYGQTKSERMALIGLLVLLSVYMGAFRGDDSLVNGKNLINFLLVYTIGWSIREYKLFEHIEGLRWFCLYIMLYVALIILFLLFEGTWFSQMLWHNSFKYNAPILIIGAIILFLCFRKISIHNTFINYVASSTFSVYLLHEGIIGHKIIYPALSSFNNYVDNVTLYATIVLLSVVIFIVCIIIDKVMNPLQKIFAGSLYNVCTYTINQCKK